jgi:hypothetical protein
MLGIAAATRSLLVGSSAFGLQPGVLSSSSLVMC